MPGRTARRNVQRCTNPDNQFSARVEPRRSLKVGCEAVNACCLRAVRRLNTVGQFNIYRFVWASPDAPSASVIDAAEIVDSAGDGSGTCDRVDRNCTGELKVACKQAEGKIAFEFQRQAPAFLLLDGEGVERKEDQQHKTDDEGRHSGLQRATYSSYATPCAVDHDFTTLES